MANQGQSKIRTVEIRAKKASLDANWESYKHIDWIKWEVPADDNYTMIIPDSAEGFSNPEDNIFKNPNTEKYYTFGDEISHTDTGDFNFTAQLKFDTENNVSEVNKIKLILSTKVDDKWESYENRPIDNTLSIAGASSTDDLNINTTFKITRAHSHIKIEVEYYKDKEQVTDTKVQPKIKDLTLKPTTSFLATTKTKENGASMKYAIKDNWTQDRDNNNIKCTVSVNGIPHILTETLRFGTKGSSGTANTFLLEMLDGKNALCIDSEKDKDGNEIASTLRIQAMLFGGNGKRVNFTAEEKKEIEWTLINKNDNYMTLNSEGDIITITSKITNGSIPTNNYAIL
jgi:hypothetical protein